MSKITWLHLSDLHLRGIENNDSLAVEKFDSMLKDIEKTIKEENMDVDVIFFTGDIAFSGDEEQYKLAVIWFDRILEACGAGGKRDRLFIVPGNHDICRREVEHSQAKHGYHQTLVECLLTSESEYDKINDFLGSNPDKEWFFTKFKGFAQFINDYYRNGEIICDDENVFDHNRYYSVRSIQKGEHTVVVLGLNSVWLSFQDNEQGRLSLGERQVREANNRWPNASMRIVLVHHPLYWLAESDIHRVYPHISNECDLLLRGHLHCSSFTVQSTPDSHLHVFAAGASLKAKFQAYNLVKLNLNTGEGTAIVKVQHPELGNNWGPDSFTYHNAKDGKLTFSIGKRKAKH